MEQVVETQVLMGEQTETAQGSMDADGLMKSLQADAYQYATTTPDNFNGGTVFMTESLDPTLRVVSEVEKNIRFFNKINKSKAYQLVEEYDTQTKYSGMGDLWIEESDSTAREEDATYNRDFQRVKMMGVRKKVTHLMTQIVSGHGDVIAKETKNGTVAILKAMERALFESNGFFNVSGSYDGSADLDALPSFNGLDKQLRKGFNDSKKTGLDFLSYTDNSLSHIVDVDNDVIQPEQIEEACRIALESDGAPNTIMLSPKAHSDFSRLYFSKERYDGAGYITPSTVTQAVNTCLGKIELENSKFLASKKYCRTASEWQNAADNTSCAGAPATVTSVDTNGATTDLEAGDYIYRVTSVTKNGESLPAVSSAITAAAGDRIQIQIADPSAGTTPTHFAVYRSAKDGLATTCKFIGYVKRAGATTNFIDLNYKKPGTSQAYLMQNDGDVMTLKQLTPLLKINFAIIELYIQWAQVLYSTFIAYRPRNMCILENISE